MSTAYKRVIHTVDSHTEGAGTRVIVGGVPVPPGKTLLEKRAWLMHHDDGMRRLINFEPRGSNCMCSVLLLPPEHEDCEFSVIIMEQDEYVPMCGHCIIGTATTVVATGMVAIDEPVTMVRLHTPAGLVECRVAVESGQVGAVSLDNVESFLLHSASSIAVEGIGEISVDIAYGGDMYAFVDADALELDLTPSNDAAQIDVGNRIRTAVREQLRVAHPEQPHIAECYQVLFTSQDTSVGDYKHSVNFPPGALDRSPCGTGTSARVALLYSRGEMGLNDSRKFEGLLGTYFSGEAIRAEERGGMLYVTPRITGRAHITGFHQFVLDRDDPLPQGFRLGRPPRSMTS